MNIQFFKRNSEILTAIGLFIAGILSRIPFRSQLFYHWDGIQFALAIRHFDVYLHQPHPPGYILYVMLGRVFNFILNDPQVSLVWLSIISSGLIAVVLYFLGKIIFNKLIGITAVLLFLSSPLFWFYGAVELSYIVGALFIVFTVLMCYQIYQGKEEYRYLISSAALLGLSGGIRQESLFFLFPLWLFSIRKVGIKKIVFSILILGLIIAAWFLPTIWLSGGFTKYFEAAGLITKYFFNISTIINQGIFVIGHNIVQLFRNMISGLGLALIPLALFLVYQLEKFDEEKIVDWYYFNKRKILFFLLWIIPPLLFSIVFKAHMSGYSFPFLLPLLILASLTICWLAKKWEKPVRKAITFLLKKAKILKRKKLSFRLSLAYILLMVIIFCFNSALFLFSGPGQPATRGEIKFHNSQFQERIDVIKNTFSPQDTVIFSPTEFLQYGFRHLMYYFPEYHVYQLQEDYALPHPKDKIIWHAYQGKTDSIEKSVIDKIIFGKDKKIILFAPLPQNLRMFFGLDLSQVKTINLPSGLQLFYLDTKNE